MISYYKGKINIEKLQESTDINKFQLMITVTWIAGRKYRKARWNQSNYQRTVNARLNYKEQRLLFKATSCLAIFQFIAFIFELAIIPYVFIKYYNRNYKLYAFATWELPVRLHMLNLTISRICDASFKHWGCIIFYLVLIFGEDTQIRKKALNILLCGCKKTIIRLIDYVYFRD